MRVMAYDDRSDNPTCTLCQLHDTATTGSVCLKGSGDKDGSLLIYLDAPNLVEDRRHRGMISDTAEFLRWLLKRMSVVNGYYIDYIVKCYPKPCKQFGNKAHRANMIEACSSYRLATLQQMKPKALIAMGTRACEAFTGSEKVSEWSGARWIPNEPFVREFLEGLWVTYSPAYALQGPSESVPIYRTLFAAAEEAGLKPKFNPKVIPYNYGT